MRLDNLKELAAEVGKKHLALGVFDGVHVGHQAVVGRAVRSAREEGGRAYVVTFAPHPIRVIAPERAPSSLLATLEEKEEILSGLGVDGVVVIRFDEEFARMGAEEFVRELCEGGGVASVAVGVDWRFGRGRMGDLVFLRRMGEEMGFRLDAVEPVMWEGDRISSTRIRQAIGDGNFEAVGKMLGRVYEVSGEVVEGRKLGRELGFPTANLRTGELQLPPDGVWVVETREGWRGVANLGVRPTVGGGERLLEVHLFDFDGYLYGKRLHVRFLKFLRGEMKFAGVDELRRQIGEDVRVGRRVIELHG